MLSFSSLPDLSFFVLDAAPVTMVAAAALGVLMIVHMSGRGFGLTRVFTKDSAGKELSEQGRCAEQALSMDTVNPARKPKRELPTVQEAYSIGDLEKLFRQMAKPYNQNETYMRFIERAEVALTPQEMWLLQRLNVIVGAKADDLAVALRHRPEQIAGPLAALQGAGYVTDGEDSLTVTEEGRTLIAVIDRARTETLEELFSEWAPGGHYEIQKILNKFIATLHREMPPEEEAEAL